MVKKVSVKRSGKKVSVKWKKITGVDGYQISVSSKKGKTRIVNTTGKNAKGKR